MSMQDLGVLAMTIGVPLWLLCEELIHRLRGRPRAPRPAAARQPRLATRVALQVHGGR